MARKKSHKPPVNLFSRDLSNWLSKNLAVNVTIASSLPQVIILTTKDRIRILLQEYKDGLIKRQVWKSSLETILTLLLTLVTSSFQNALGLSADLWQLIFIVLFVFLTFRTIYYFIADLKTKNKNRSDIDHFVAKMSKRK